MDETPAESDPQPLPPGERSMLHALAGVAESTSILAHDIKNPRTGIQMALRILAEGLDQEHETVLKKLLGRLEDLETRIRGALDLKRLLAVAPTPFPAERLVRLAVGGVEGAAAAAQVRIETDVPPDELVLAADPRLATEALRCLLENAVEAVEPGGRVAVSAEPDGDFALFTVDDDGPGVLESLEERLFRPFATSKPERSGLGLTIARQIAEAHGGDLAQEESRLGGAAFRLRLPRNP